LDLDELTIEYEGYSPWKVRKLVIGERAGKRPALPEQLQMKETDSSRLLMAAEHKHKDRVVKQLLPSRSEQLGRRMAPMFESFYDMNHTPFTRDLPTDHLYDSTMMDEILGLKIYG
jgi:hypothetical protein